MLKGITIKVMSWFYPRKNVKPKLRKIKRKLREYCRKNNEKDLKKLLTKKRKRRM